MQLAVWNRLTVAAGLVALLFAGPAAAQETPVMAGYGPLTPAQKEVFWGSAEDPAADKLLATEERLEGRHYVTCDEWNLHLFRDRIAGLGGGYAGVGTDQAYLFIGWQRPHLAWLMDYDPWVVYIHEAYRVFFAQADTIEEFLAFWTKENRKKTRKFLQEKLADHPDVRMIVKVYNKNRYHIDRRLRRVVRKLEEKKIPCYLTDPEMYAFVRQLVMSGRVRPMLGNLLDDKGMQGLAEASRKLGVPLRVLYLSNAEGYWKYGDSFRQNIIAQNFDDKSLILRTVAAKWTNGDYRYNIQKAANFQEWMKADWVRSYKQIVPLGKLKGKGDIPLTYVDKDPESARKD